MSSFTSLNLDAAHLDNLKQLGYQNMTEVQEKSLPHVLAGKDLIVKAPTGSGKTLAFGLGIMNRLDPKINQIQALVLCPTRELAAQAATVLRELARPLGDTKILQLCGGSALGPQIHSLRHGAHLVVGTPGRVLDLLQRDELELDKVKTLVLDEGDRMLDMGFYEDISKISLACPLRRQTLLFSATFPPPLLKASEGFLIKPQEITVESDSAAPEIVEKFYKIENDKRFETAKNLLLENRCKSAIVFANTIEQCDAFAHYLKRNGTHCLALHGQLEQRDREDIMVQFRNQSCPVLIATDVAARGLDISGLDLVVNMDISPNAETHLHRIGRTGRHNSKGLALNLVAPQETYRAQRLVAENEVIDWYNAPRFKKEPAPLQGHMRTLCIKGGKKDKLRAGDILGALTKDVKIPGSAVGKIAIFDFVSFVAIERKQAEDVLQKLQNTQMKGRNFKMRLMS